LLQVIKHCTQRPTPILQVSMSETKLENGADITQKGPEAASLTTTPGLQGVLCFAEHTAACSKQFVLHGAPPPPQRSALSAPRSQHATLAYLCF
jgi:hypothetical protein